MNAHIGALNAGSLIQMNLVGGIAHRGIWVGNILLGRRHIVIEGDRFRGIMGGIEIVRGQGRGRGIEDGVTVRR